MVGEVCRYVALLDPVQLGLLRNVFIVEELWSPLTRKRAHAASCSTAAIAGAAASLDGSSCDNPPCAR